MGILFVFPVNNTENDIFSVVISGLIRGNVNNRWLCVVAAHDNVVGKRRRTEKIV